MASTTNHGSGASLVFVLDGIDQVEEDNAEVLLALLDPSRRKAFKDEFVAVPFDLSEVLWIPTAVDRTAIPAVLRDCLEIVELPAYTDEEKLTVAEQHLLARPFDASVRLPGTSFKGVAVAGSTKLAATAGGLAGATTAALGCGLAGARRRRREQQLLLEEETRPTSRRREATNILTGLPTRMSRQDQREITKIYEDLGYDEIERTAIESIHPDSRELLTFLRRCNSRAAEHGTGRGKPLREGPGNGVAIVEKNDQERTAGEAFRSPGAARVGGGQASPDRGCGRQAGGAMQQQEVERAAIAAR